MRHHVVCFVERALPDAVQRVHVSIVSLATRTVACDGDVLLAGFAQFLNFELGWIVAPERAYEVDGGVCDGAHCFRAPVVEQTRVA